VVVGRRRLTRRQAYKDLGAGLTVDELVAKWDVNRYRVVEIRCQWVHHGRPYYRIHAEQLMPAWALEDMRLGGSPDVPIRRICRHHREQGERARFRLERSGVLEEMV